MGIHCLISSTGLCIFPSSRPCQCMKLDILFESAMEVVSTPLETIRQLASSSQMTNEVGLVANTYIYIYIIYWLVVEPTPLKNMSSSIGMIIYSQSMESHNPAMFQSPPSRSIWTHQVVMLWHSPPCPGEPNHQEEQQAQGQERTESHHGEEGAAWKVGTGGLYQWIERMGRPGKAGIHRIISSTPYETYDKCTQSFEIIISSRKINKMK